MPEGKGIGGRAFAFLSGLAAVATVIAGAVAILAQFGLIASHDSSKTVVVTVSPAALPSIAPQQLASAPLPAKAKAERIAVAKASEATVPQTLAPENPSPPQSPAASKTLAMVDRSQIGSIGGAWRDRGIGACHLINQKGNKFEVWNYDPVTGELIGQGEGSIDGNHVEIEFTNGRRPVTLDFHVAPGGDTMLGKVIRADGTHRAIWNYLGATCPRPG